MFKFVLYCIIVLFEMSVRYRDVWAHVHKVLFNITVKAVIMESELPYELQLLYNASTLCLKHFEFISQVITS